MLISPDHRPVLCGTEGCNANAVVLEEAHKARLVKFL